MKGYWRIVHLSLGSNIFGFNELKRLHLTARYLHKMHMSDVPQEQLPRAGVYSDD